MKISPDIFEVIKIRSKGKTHYSNFFKNLKIISASLSPTSAHMQIEIPVIEVWTDTQGLLSDQALAMLIDIIPLPICWTFNENNMMNLDLNISRISHAKLGEMLTLDLYCDEVFNKKIVNIKVEVRVEGRMIANACSSVKFIRNTNWREDKL